MSLIRMPKAANVRPRDKRQVADSFSRAAETYDAMAALQRRVGHQLLAHAGDVWKGQVLDLGCGTGYFSRILAEEPQVETLLALDLAEGMVRYGRARRSHERICWLCGDGERLPLADGSVDGIFTSLAIQWCNDTGLLFDELRRVLRPGGLLAFATLGPRTLFELRSAWSEVDDYEHVNRFEPRAVIKAAAESRFAGLRWHEQEIVLRYRELRGLTDDLKGIGAHNVNPGRVKGLSGRARIRAFRAAYERFRGGDGLLPATYQVFYGICRAGES